MPEPVAEQDLPEELYNEILNPARRFEFVFRELRIREDWTHFEVEEVPLYLRMVPAITCIFGSKNAG